MDRLGKRLERIEQQAHVGGECQCPGGLRVLFDGDGSGTQPESGVEAPALCPSCGRPRITVRVLYGAPEGPSERI